MPIGSAPAAATDSILKPIQTIHTLFIRNRRMARWLALTCARAAAPAFLRALLRSVAAEVAGREAAAVAAPAAVGVRAGGLPPHHPLQPSPQDRQQRLPQLARARRPPVSACM